MHSLDRPHPQLLVLAQHQLSNDIKAHRVIDDCVAQYHRKSLSAMPDPPRGQRHGYVCVALLMFALMVHSRHIVDTGTCTVIILFAVFSLIYCILRAVWFLDIDLICTCNSHSFYASGYLVHLYHCNVLHVCAVVLHVQLWCGPTNSSERQLPPPFVCFHSCSDFSCRCRLS